jgi:hypothetical protein
MENEAARPRSGTLIVTGGGRGIGAATAMLAATRGSLSRSTSRTMRPEPTASLRQSSQAAAGCSSFAATCALAGNAIFLPETMERSGPTRPPPSLARFGSPASCRRGASLQEHRNSGADQAAPADVFTLSLGLGEGRQRVTASEKEVNE